MKTKFQFDKKTGTMVAAEQTIQQAVNAKINNDVVEVHNHGQQEKPVFKEENKVDIKSSTINVSKMVVQMKRVNHPTAIQLVDEKGKPEAYLDSITTGVMMFRDRQDYDICQIADERTGKVLCYIGGYALQINFNMAELRTLERVEQCLQGLTKLFRHKIMTQTLDSNSEQND